MYAVFLFNRFSEILAALVFVNCDNLARVASTFAALSAGRFLTALAIQLLDSFAAARNPFPPCAAASAICPTLKPIAVNAPSHIACSISAVHSLFV